MPRLENFKEKYGEVEGNLKYELWRRRNSEAQKGSRLQKYIKKYGEIEGREKFDIFRCKSAHTEEKYIKQLGELEGKKVWSEYVELKSKTSKRSLKYWLEVFKGDYDSAKQAQHEFQNNTSLGRFVKKHGQEKGNILYKQKGSKHSSFLHEYYKIEENRKKKGLFLGNTHSLISNDLFKELITKIEIDEGKVYYATNLNGEYFIERNNKLFFYDLVIPHLKLIIEFNGDFWHANPMLFKEDFFHPILKKNAKEIWSRDKIKNGVAIENGFKVIVVWEKEYRQNKKEVLENLIKLINERNS